jgi:hypothetical protein
MGVKTLGKYMSQDLNMEMVQVDVRGGCWDRDFGSGDESNESEVFKTRKGLRPLE